MEIFASLLETNFVSDQQSFLYHKKNLAVDRRFHQKELGIYLIIPKSQIHENATIFKCLKSYVESHAKKLSPKLKVCHKMLIFK